MVKLIEVKIDSLRVSLTNQQRIVVLKQIDTNRYLPIWIGPYEAEAITIALQEIEVSRPQTHDLLKNMIASLNAKLKKVIIKDLKDDIFYGVLVVEVNGKELEIDSRPSDAIAVAVRAHIPILVSKKVMDEASIIPEDVLEVDEAPTEGEETKPESGHLTIAEDRLSIFENYLDKKNNQSDAEENSADKDESENTDK
ncbi:MAG: bifunctional nuclease family protein [Anaerolineaceae bacterium]|nr:bifunctional nuclease family protein [Anaerolineaceae bacterium]